ncbi:hypothetical protein KR018_008161, partial [Drosophila ironensis]
LNLILIFPSERRISAFQLRTIDSAEDDSSSSGREESGPESPHGLQPSQYQPGPQQQYGQFLGVNGQGGHQGRSRTKKTKVRSKSLQPPTNIIPWRKASRPNRGRSLDKQPFLPGFKPEPVKSWTEETISLKATPIEKKKPTPKLEAATVVLKSIKTERDQGIMSLGATLEQIIAGKTEKEAVPWITMREKLKAVESVQEQLNKFDLDEVYLQPLEGQIETEQPQPQQLQRSKEIQRLKSMESVEIMEMTDQIDKLITQQQNNKDLIPWKEMRQQLKSVQRVTKQIDKFKIEEVELRHLQAQQAIAEEYQTGALEDTILVDESSKGSISKIIKHDQMQQKQYEDQSAIYRQQFVTTEDVNIMHVSESEKLEAQRLLHEQQAVNWRQQQQRPQLQPLTSVEDTRIDNTSLERQELFQQQRLNEQTLRQQFIQVEDSQITSLEQYEHQALIKQRTQQEAFNWRQQREPQKFIQVEDSSLLHRQERHDTESQQLLQPQPVIWERGRKKPEKPQQEQQSPVAPVPQEFVEKPRTYEEMHDELVEPAPMQEQSRPVPFMWERGKKKSQQEITFEEAHDVLEETTLLQSQPEQVPVLWERGIKKSTLSLKEQVVNDKFEKIEEQQKTTRRVIPPRPQEEKVEQVTLKPTPRPQHRQTQKTEELQLKHLRATTPQHSPVKAFEEATDELLEESTLQMQEQPQPVLWERGKKKDQKLLEEAPTLEVAFNVLEEEGPKPMKPQPEPVFWERGKKQKTEQQMVQEPLKSLEVTSDVLDDKLMPVEPQPHPALWERGKKNKSQPHLVAEETISDVPSQSYEEAVDVVPEESNQEEQPQPVLWQRGKKKTPKLQEEVHPDEVDAQIESVVQEEHIVDEKRRVVKKTKKPKPTKEISEEVPEKVDELVIQEEEATQEHIVEDEQDLVKEKIKHRKKQKPAPKKTEIEEVIEDVEETVKEQDEREVDTQPNEQTEITEELVANEPEKLIQPASKAQEVNQVEKVTLKPASRAQRHLPEKELVESVSLKPIKKTAFVSEAPESEINVNEHVITTEDQVEDTAISRVKKKKPKAKTTVEHPEPENVEQLDEKEPQLEEEELQMEEEEPQLEEVHPINEAPAKKEPVEKKTKPKPKKEDIVEKVDEVTLKKVVRPKKELPQEATIEAVQLKPTQRTTVSPDELQLEEVDLQHVEKKEPEIVQEEKRKTKKVKKTKHEELPEIADSEPTQLEEAEHFDIERTSKPDKEETQEPWKRGEKKKPVEEVLEEKQWPTGKRRPMSEEQPEEVQLKPIPAKPVDEPQESKKAIPGPKHVPEEKVESESETPGLGPIKVSDEKQPEVKKEKKKKLKLKKVTPSVDEVSEDMAEPFEEPIAEEAEGIEVAVEDDKVVAYSEEVLPEEESMVPTEESTDAITQRALKKRTKKHKEATVEGQPQLLEAAIAEIEKVDEISQEISQKTITLLKKTEDTRPQFITTEQLIELDVDDVRRDLEMKVTSNIIKKEKRRVVLDDSQPLPELELITQKRVQEGIDKVADEELIEDQQLVQNQQETTTSEVMGQERKLVKKKKKEIKPPRITEKLRPRQCVPDEPTVLECKVEGVPFPEINWYFNDILLFASEKYEITIVEQVAQLKIAKVTPSDVGVYTCEAKNEAGVATSRTNIILEKEQGVAPRFSKPLKIEFTEEKQPERLKVTVTCQVTGKPQPQVKWYRGIEEVIPNETVQMLYNEETGDVALEVINPTPNEAVVYSVQAQNQFGRAIGNANIMSRVDEMPREILKAPTVTPLNAVVVPTGGTLFFEAKYDGIPRPEIRWMRNGREIVENDEICVETTETTTTIRVINMTRKRTGKYEIWAKNKVGEAKSSGSVVVSDQKPEQQIKPPRFVKPIEPKLFGEHEVALIEVVVDSEPLSSFQWFVHNEPLKSSNEVRIVSQANKSTLLIEDFQRKFAGPFTCRAENVGGSVTSTATVNLLETLPQEETVEFESPRFIEELGKTVEVMDGESLLLNCQVTGKPTPKVEWYHNEEKITENKETTILQDVQGICQLQISEVFPENQGHYKCVASNKIGKSVTKTVVNIQGTCYLPTLSIDEQAPKIIKKLPEKIEPKEGEQAKLEVKVIGKPKPKVKWLRDDEQIFASEEYQIENFDDGTSVLVINHVYPDDLGTISFEAYNPLGVAVTTALFAVEGIVGSKDYRKPEWVTHMEEMQVALKG